MRWQERNGQRTGRGAAAAVSCQSVEQREVRTRRGAGRSRPHANSLTAVVTPRLSTRSVLEQENVSDGQLPGVCECQEGAGGAECGEPPRGAAMELKPRRTVATHDLDTRPEHALRVPGPERFHGRFFRGKARCKRRSIVAFAAAIGDFTFREHAPNEALTVAADGF